MAKKVLKGIKQEVEGAFSAETGYMYMVRKSEGGGYVQLDGKKYGETTKDWQENDSGSSAYIENRTHYDVSEEGNLTTLVKNYLFNNYENLNDLEIQISSASDTSNVTLTNTYKFASIDVSTPETPGSNTTGTLRMMYKRTVSGRISIYNLYIDFTRLGLVQPGQNPYNITSFRASKDLSSETTITNVTGSLIYPVKLDNKYLHLDDEVTEYSTNAVTSNAVYNALQNAGGLFVAEYESTTYQEIADAYNSGKTVILRNNDNDYIGQLSFNSEDRFVFIVTDMNNMDDLYVIYYTVDTNDEWTTNTIYTDNEYYAFFDNTTIDEISQIYDNNDNENIFCSYYTEDYCVADGDFLDTRVPLVGTKWDDNKGTYVSYTFQTIQYLQDTSDAESGFSYYRITLTATLQEDGGEEYTEWTSEIEPLSLGNDIWVSGEGENSAVLKGSNGTAFGANSVVEGTSVTNAIERGITSESTDAEIITEWSGSTPDTDKFSLAKGEASHVEGNNGLAIGVHSHVEGNGCIAGNNSSHAEGTGSYAAGKYAHAEGLETLAEGSRSHAEGAWTKAIPDESHAEGQYSEARARASHAEGYKSVTSKEGYSSNTLSPHAQGTGTSSWVNACSHAEGNATIAQGLGAHAEGEKTFANERATHAEGCETVASGESSHSEGKQTSALTQYSHSEGYLTTASGESSHAEGRSTTAKGNRSHAEGMGTQAIGNQSHAEGNDTIARAWASHTEGYNTEVGGSWTANTKTEDTDNKPGDTSHAEGNATIAKGPSSHSEGIKTFATGKASHAEGSGTTASGQSSHAEGTDTYANGYCSHAEGNETTASGDYSHAEGFKTISQNSGEHAQGWLNKSNCANDSFGNSGNTILSVGIGQAENDRKNAFEIMQNGDAYLYGVGGYSGTSITGDVKTLQEVLNNIPSKAGSAVIYLDGSDAGTDVFIGPYRTNANYLFVLENIGQPISYVGLVTDGNEGGNVFDVKGNIPNEIRYDKVICSNGDAYVRINYHNIPFYQFSTNVTVTDFLGNETKILGSTTEVESQGSSISSTTQYYYASSKIGSYYLVNTTSGSYDEIGYAWSCGKFVILQDVSGYTYMPLNGSRYDAPTKFSNVTEDDSGVAYYNVYTIKPNNNQWTLQSTALGGGGDSLWESGNGTYSIQQKGTGAAALADYAYAEGSGTTSSGMSSHAEGGETSAIGDASHAEGGETTAHGVASHAEGGSTTAYGDLSHAEGYNTTASGSGSHSEGAETFAYGDASHAEGVSTQAYVDGSHAEGSETVSSGICAHAEGRGTTALNIAEHAEGQFNISHTGVTNADNTQHSIGVGTSSENKKNAIEVMQNGDTYILGIGGYSGTTISGCDTLQEELTVANTTEIDALFSEGGGGSGSGGRN